MNTFKVISGIICILFIACSKYSDTDDRFRAKVDIFASEDAPIQVYKNTFASLGLDTLAKISPFIAAISNVSAKNYQTSKGIKFTLVNGDIVKTYKGACKAGEKISFISFANLPPIQDSTIVVFFSPLKNFKLLRKYNLRWQQQPHSPLISQTAISDSLLSKNN